MNEYKLQHDNNHQFHIDKNSFKYAVYGCEQLYIDIYLLGGGGDVKSPAVYRLMDFFMNKCIGIHKYLQYSMVCLCEL